MSRPPQGERADGIITMWQLIHTKVLDSADSIEASVGEYETMEAARAALIERTEKVMGELYNNEFLKGRVSIRGNKAVVFVESECHVLAVVGGNGRK